MTFYEFYKIEGSINIGTDKFMYHSLNGPASIYENTIWWSFRNYDFVQLTYENNIYYVIFLFLNTKAEQYNFFSHEEAINFCELKFQKFIKLQSFI